MSTGSVWHCGKSKSWKAASASQNHWCSKIFAEMLAYEAANWYNLSNKVVV